MTAPLTSSGFPQIPDYGDPRLYTPVVPGTDVRPLGGVLRGDVGTILVEVMRLWDQGIQKLTQAAGCWGYRPGNIAGTNTPTNHSSGTAVDIMAALYPQHADTLGGPGQSTGVLAALGILGRINGLVGGRGVLVWGGTWDSRWLDQMHWEIAPNASLDDLRRTGALIRSGALGTVPPLHESASGLPAAGYPWIGFGGVVRGPLVARVQRRLAARGYKVGAIDGLVGPLFDGAVRAAKSHAPAELELSKDGRVGPDTWRYFRP